MKKPIWVLALVAAGGIAYFGFIRQPAPNPRFEPFDDDRSVPVVSTRGRYRDGDYIHAARGYEVIGDVPGTSSDSGCAGEVMIVVHGFNNSLDKAINRFATARMALQKSGYAGVVVGYSWDADTQHDPYSMTGYRTGREHAAGNGEWLGKLISKMKANCPTMAVRVIGYSMGARLALECLEWLEPGIKVDSIHLVGAAMDNEEVELGKRYGRAIEEKCRRAFNYYSPEDSKLGLFFWAKEGDRALGKADIEHEERRPRNLLSRDSIDHLPEADEATGELVPGGKKGRNHSGYLGTRNNKGMLTDDGVMDLVAKDAAQFK